MVEMEKDMSPFPYILLFAPPILHLCLIYVLSVCDEVSFMFFLTRHMLWYSFLAIKTVCITLTLRRFLFLIPQVAVAALF
jgi:hypothetical protein